MMAGECRKDNLAVVLHGAMDLRMEHVPVPDPGYGEVLLAMGSVGICGSDLKYWTSGYCARFVIEQPMISGHEGSGTVLAVGPGVTHLKPGDRVAIEPGVPCLQCRLCKIGRYNLCPTVTFCATPPDDGNLCNFYKHAADFCFKLPDHVTLDEGAMLEPLSVAIYTCRRGGVTLGSKILICGAGPVGLLTLMVARTYGASKIVVTDIDDYRLQRARCLGADYTVMVNSNDPVQFAEEVRKVLGDEPDITMECSGADFSLLTAIHVTAPGGSIVMVGRGSPTPSLPLSEILAKELEINGIFRYANCYPAALELLASETIDVKPLITHHFSLKESLKAFETAKSRDTQAIKVMIHCN